MSDEKRPESEPKPEPEAAGPSRPEGEGVTADDGRERMDLPKWNRARVKRAQPKGEGAPETDAFQQGVRQAGRAAVRRGPLVALGILAFAGTIGGVIWWSQQGSETRATATRPLAEAAAYRHRGKLVDLAAKPVPPPTAAELDQTIDRKLAEVADADGNEKAQMLALLVRAGRQVESADFAGAEASYREFLTRAGTGHDLAFLAQEGVAIAKEGQGDLDGALAEYEQLAGNVGDFYRDQALYHQGRVLERLGRKDDALARYKQYVQEFPLEDTSIARAAVRERLTELDPTMVLPEDPAPTGLSELLGP